MITYGDVYHQNEVEQSTYNFEHSNADMLFQHVRDYEAEAKRLMAASLALPAYEMVLKAAHTFNLLDARGAISVTERQGYIGRIRTPRRAGVWRTSYYESRQRSWAFRCASLGRKKAAWASIWRRCKPSWRNARPRSRAGAGMSATLLVELLCEELPPARR